MGTDRKRDSFGEQDQSPFQRKTGRAVVVEANKNLTQLVEINRALSQDLDTSRRLVADLSRECERYREEIDRLLDEAENKEVSKLAEEKLNQVRGGKRETEELQRELDLMTRDAAAAKSRADYAEARYEKLSLEFENVIRERDEAMSQLEESTAAMEEIRCHLASNIVGARSIYSCLT